MNYGKYSISKKQKRLRRRRVRIGSFARVLLLRLFLLAMVICLIGAASGIYGVYKGIVSRAPNPEIVNAAPVSQNTKLYYSDGVSVIGTLRSSDNELSYVTYENISKYAVDAFICLLDAGFWEHNGADLSGLLSTLLDSNNTPDSDGLTITGKLISNQLFKNTNEDLFSDRLVRAVQEQYLAVRLEAYTPKERIIEYYLNTINLGSGSYGIQNAAKEFFGKNASELTVSEAALLAPLALSPTGMNPITHADANKEKRQEALDKMYAGGDITAEQYEEAIADTENVYLLASRNASMRLGDEPESSYFVDALCSQIIQDLTASGYSEYEAAALLYSGGLTIYTTQDREVQAILDEEFTNEENFPKIGEGAYYELSDSWTLSIYSGNGDWVFYRISDLLDYFSAYEDTEGIYIHQGGSTGISALTLDKKDLEEKIELFIQDMMVLNRGVRYSVSNDLITLEPQAAMVIMDQQTGSVIAMYGGRGSTTEAGDINRSIDLLRQPGSAFMTLSAFLPAIDTGGYTLASVFDDSSYSYEAAADVPESIATVDNWYTTGYEGLSSIRRGIYHSMNIVAARCFEKTGGGTSLSYLHQLGFSSLSDTSDRSQKLALGELSNGVTLLELTGAYAAVANDGYYFEPKLYTAVYDSDGKLLLDNSHESTQIIKTSTAKLLSSAMKDTVIKGTGSRCAFKAINVDIAGKTGVSAGNNDLWFIGYTPYYCAGIWSGFDTGFPQSQTQYHKEMWSRVMERIHVFKGQTEGSLMLPPGYEEVKICSKCGNLAYEGLCDENVLGNLIVSEYFAPGTAPESRCTCCKRVTLCKESGTIASSNCTDTVSVVLLDKEDNGTRDSAGSLNADISTVCTIHGNREDQ